MKMPEIADLKCAFGDLQLHAGYRYEILSVASRKLGSDFELLHRARCNLKGGFPKLLIKYFKERLNCFLSCKY